MRFTRHISQLAAIASLAFASTPVLADAITLGAGNVGQSWNFAFNGATNGATDLSSTAKFTLTSVTPTSYTFSYSLSNTNSAPAYISGFGLQTNPLLASASSNGTFSYATLANYPNGTVEVDVCLKATTTTNCPGAPGGVFQGGTGTGSFSLNFAQPLTSLTLDGFLVRYQVLQGLGAVSVVSNSGKLTSSSGTPVPEPGMIGLLGGALAGIALARRRRAQKVRVALA